MQVNARNVLVIFPTRDSQLFSSLQNSLSKSIVTVKEMPIRYNSITVGVADKTKGTKRRKQQHAFGV